LYWLTTQKIKFKDAFISTSVLLVVPAVLFLALWQWSEAENNLNSYLHIQLLASLKGQRDQSSHISSFQLLGDIFNTLIPIFVVLVLIIIAKKIWVNKLQIKPNYRLALFFLLAGFSSSFPVMISPKQMIHYVLCSIPFYAIAASIVALPMVEQLISKINLNGAAYKWTYRSMLILLICVFIFSLSRIGKFGRDKEMLTDLKELETVLPKGATISCNDYVFYNFQLNLYLYRFYHISLDSKNTELPYYLANLEYRYKVPYGYSYIKTKAKGFFLYRKN
jgi:hypothetical protein